MIAPCELGIRIMPLSQELETFIAEVRLGVFTSPVCVRTLSEEGAVISDFPLARAGDALSIHFPNHRRVRAHVVEVSAGVTALRFDEPLPQDEVSSVRLNGSSVTAALHPAIA
jgi:hypothetical protein